MAGGGKVLIGGDTGGGHPGTAAAQIAKAALEAQPIATASNVRVDAASSIDASAVDAGDGGKVIVWADGSTTFNGHAAARGGAASGDGGFIETSSHDTLRYDGSVDLKAPNGANGTLLLDPLNVQIGGAAGTQTVSVAALQSALASGNVVVTTGSTGTDAGDITAAESFSWTNNSDLTLEAFRNIAVLDGVTIANTGAGDLSLRADATGIGIGDVQIVGTGRVNWAGSTGRVSIFYNPEGGYGSPVNYGPLVLTDAALPGQLTAYMLVNDVFDLQNINENLGGAYALGRNIDASETAIWNEENGFIPLGSQAGAFEGRLDGRGHQITGLTIDRLSRHVPLPNVGLFAVIGANGVINNLTVADVDIVTEADEFLSTSLFDVHVGILAGTSHGTIENVSVSGQIRGDSYYGVIGGIVGENWGVISKSNSSASVNGWGHWIVGGVVGRSYGGVADSSSSGAVIGPLFYPFQGCCTPSSQTTGGLIGWNFGTVRRSYSTAYVEGGAAGGLIGQNEGLVTEAQATGNVLSGTGAVGGLVGHNSGTIERSFAQGNIHSVSGNGVGGLVGENVASIVDSYATGGASGGPFVFAEGALVGLNWVNGHVARSYGVGPVNGFENGSAIGVSGFLGGGTHAFVYGVTDTAGTPGALTGAEFQAGLPVGFNPTVWGSNPSINNGYPHLLWQTEPPPPPPPLTTILAPPFTIAPPPPSPPSPPEQPPTAALTGSVYFAANGFSDYTSGLKAGITGAVEAVLDWLRNLMPPTPNSADNGSTQQDKVSATTSSTPPRAGGSGQLTKISSLRSSNALALGSDGQNHATVLQPIDSATFTVLGKQISLNAYANVRIDGGQIVENPSGPFQCTAIVKRYLVQLGLADEVRDHSIGFGAVVVETLRDTPAFNGSFTISLNGQPGAERPSVGSIVSMKTNQPAGHVAIIKRLEPVGETLVATLVEENMSPETTSSFAVNRTIVFSKDAQGNWVAGNHTMVQDGPERSVVGWATPTSPSQEVAQQR